MQLQYKPVEMNLMLWRIFLPVALRPNADHGLHIIDVSISHKMTHLNR
jgi:hypothetical protein